MGTISRSRRQGKAGTEGSVSPQPRSTGHGQALASLPAARLSGQRTDRGILCSLRNSGLGGRSSTPLKRHYGFFGRTMAQPIRSSGWRPFTSHSKARGTSGTRPGKRLAMSAGGVPAVSDARQTTMPPVSLNFAGVSHGVRCGAASSSRCGRPDERDQARELRIAGDRAQRLVGAPLKTVAEKARDRARRQRGRHLGGAGPGQEQRDADRRQRGRDDHRSAQTVRSNRCRRR